MLGENGRTADGIANDDRQYHDYRLSWWLASALSSRLLRQEDQTAEQPGRDNGRNDGEGERCRGLRDGFHGSLLSLMSVREILVFPSLECINVFLHRPGRKLRAFA